MAELLMEGVMSHGLPHMMHDIGQELHDDFAKTMAMAASVLLGVSVTSGVTLALAVYLRNPEMVFVGLCMAVPTIFLKK